MSRNARSRTSVWVATAALVLPLLVGGGHLAAAGSASSAPSTERVVLSPGATVTIAGRGYGHGRGMSQYGARAAAASGVGYQSILDFYYPGTTRVTQSDQPIKVLISADTDNETRVLAVPGMTASDSVNSDVPIGLAGRAVTQWRIIRGADGFFLEGLADGAWHRWSQGASPGFLSLSAPSGFIRLVLPQGNQKDYRGTVRAVPDGSAPRLRTVNVLGMEQYLRAVVPAESPAGWPADALRAQAVAARTYASYERRQSGNKAWQTCDTTQCQVYSGFKSFDSSGRLTATHEAGTTDAAVRATANQVRHYGGAPAFTQFGSSNGGWTAPGGQPYLVARADAWDGVGNPVHAWSVRVTSAQLRTAFPTIGVPRTIDVTSRSGPGEWGGRVTQVVISGSGGTTTLTGATFRAALGLRSDWWKPTGSTRLDPDLTADGRPDIIAQSSDGSLRAYEGNGSGGFDTMRTIGVGWGALRLAVRANDLTSDGNPDVLGVDQAGTLWLYPADGRGGFGARSAVGPGWASIRRIVAPGDIDGDGRSDLLAVDASGVMWSYSGNGGGGFGERRRVGPGWTSMTQVLGGGDWDGDGHSDLLAVDKGGNLLLYRGNGAGGFSPRQVGNGWSGMRLVAALGDWDGDRRPDLVAADTAGALYLYPWTGSSFSQRKVIGNGWGSITRLL